MHIKDMRRNRINVTPTVIWGLLPERNVKKREMVGIKYIIECKCWTTVGVKHLDVIIINKSVNKIHIEIR